MLIRHVRFEFDTDAPTGSKMLDRLKAMSTRAADPFRTLYAEAQFAAVETIPTGPNRREFPALERVRLFAMATRDRWHRKACGHAPENPVTLEHFAERLHKEAAEHVRLYPLVAAHAVRLSWYESFDDAVTYLSCAVPLVVAAGQITYRKPAGAF